MMIVWGVQDHSAIANNVALLTIQHIIYSSKSAIKSVLRGSTVGVAMSASRVRCHVLSVNSHQICARYVIH